MGDTRSQPSTISLVDDLRMDADMLKDGHQENLTKLWHSDVVTEAAKNALRAAARIEELERLNAKERYEAGMYKSLYEVAKVRIEELTKNDDR